MGGACGQMGRREACKGFGGENKERDYLGDPDIDGRI